MLSSQVQPSCQFLAEYSTTMGPVAQATDILQAETNALMGRLLPTIGLLSHKLERVQLKLKYCQPLAEALLVGHGAKKWTFCHAKTSTFSIIIVLVIVCTHTMCISMNLKIFGHAISCNYHRRCY